MSGGAHSVEEDDWRSLLVAFLFYAVLVLTVVGGLWFLITKVFA